MPLLILGMLRAAWALRREPQFVSLALLTLIAIVSGTAFYSLVEGLRFVDALYFSVVTLTTVGYGDFAPETDIGKLFRPCTYSSASAFFSPLSQRSRGRCRRHLRCTRSRPNNRRSPVQVPPTGKKRSSQLEDDRHDEVDVLRSRSPVDDRRAKRHLPAVDRGPEVHAAVLEHSLPQLTVQLVQLLFRDAG